MEHLLKTWPEYFKRVESGQKTFEVRKNDRDFQVNDILLLEYFDPKANNLMPPEYRSIRVKVIYILPGGNFGVYKDYCVMSIEKIEKN